MNIYMYINNAKFKINVCLNYVNITGGKCLACSFFITRETTLVHTCMYM